MSKIQQQLQCKIRMLLWEITNLNDDKAYMPKQRYNKLSV